MGAEDAGADDATGSDDAADAADDAPGVAIDSIDVSIGVTGGTTSKSPSTG